jgi:hypothetical protein
MYEIATGREVDFRMKARLIHCWVNQRLGMQGKEKKDIYILRERGWGGVT